MKIVKLLPLALVSVALFSCEPNDPTDPHEEEVITTLNIDLEAGGSTVALNFQDIDGDGDLDVLTTNYNGYYHLYKNDGDSNPNFEQTLFGQRRGYMVQPYEMDHGDIDGDGDLDLISISNYENKVYWYENE